MRARGRLLGHRLRLHLALIAAATAVAHLSTACGGGRTPPGVVQGATAADREFINEMAEVLETAFVSTGQAIANAGRAELKDYARTARDELARQLSAIRSLDQVLFSQENAGFGAIPPQIAPGRDFDREWLTSMIQLHRLGVEVAAARLGDDERGDPRAEALARQLRASEQQELEKLRGWARQWFGSAP